MASKRIQATVRCIVITSMALAASAGHGQSRLDMDRARKEMVDNFIVAAGVKDPRVIRSMLETPRHEFVPYKDRRNAYYDMALPIGASQTISSPFIVAFMTESLDPQPTDKVLEIGTGSGFQAAVLSPLVKEVYSIEIVEMLGERAARTLRRLGYDNVFTKVGDGFKGWPEHAPFDKIIVTCSPDEVPKPLVEQLREGGLMVVPVGDNYQQTLYLLRKKDGQLQSEALRPTLFVPMTGIAEGQGGDPAEREVPKIVNGGFEAPLGENEFVPGWYYQRQVSLASGIDAPEGEQYVTVKNQLPRRAAHIMQGFSIDGRKYSSLTFSAWVKHANTQRIRELSVVPAVAITFYDDQRKDVGLHYLGPFLGTSSWQRHSKTVRVPPQSRQGILRVGLFGTTGEISCDDVRIEARAR
jgi:protein-L-isoaspartate(D-aspartate) O-methyltransferase